MDYSYLAPLSQVSLITHSDYYIKHNEKEKGCRKIFETVEYDSFEQTKIKELKAEIQAKNIQLPVDWKESDYLKIAYTARFKIKEVIKNLQIYLQWRTNKIYHELNTQTEKFLKEGICYVFGRDKQFRPIVILNAHLIDQKKYDKEIIIQALSFMLGIVKKYMFIPGKVENWIFLLETNNVGVFGLPVKALQSIIQNLTINFASCLEKMFILNPSSGLNFLWKTIKGLLDDETVQKINFIQFKEFNKLQEIIAANQLESRYGGIQPNQIKFWPPYNLDLIDGYTVQKKQEQVVNEQNQDFKPQSHEDPYDKIELNLNDFMKEQHQIYYSGKLNIDQNEIQKSDKIEEIQQQKVESPINQKENNEPENQDIQQNEEEKSEKQNEQLNPPLQEEPEPIQQVNDVVQQQDNSNEKQQNLSIQPQSQEVYQSTQQAIFTERQKESLRQKESQGNSKVIIHDEASQTIKNSEKVNAEDTQNQNCEIQSPDPIITNQACCQGCLIF